MVASFHHLLRTLVAISLTSLLLPTSTTSIIVQAFQQPSSSTIHHRSNRLMLLEKPNYFHRTTTELNATPQSQPQPPTTTTTTKEGSRPRRQPTKKKKRRKKRIDSRRQQQQHTVLKNPNELETWRVYGIDVDPDTLGVPSLSLSLSSTTTKTKGDDILPTELLYLTPPVLSALVSRLRIKSEPATITPLQRDGSSSISSISSSNDVDEVEDDTTVLPSLPPQLKDARVVRRSLDARRRKGAPPKYTYVIDITLTKESAQQIRLAHQPGRTERMTTKKKNKPPKISSGNEINEELESEESKLKSKSNSKPKILIVGAGPAGLFCALSLASSGLFTPILLERGQAVEARGKSIGALINRRDIDPNSNFSFGEGGAGTWSDGKLTTRIGRNSGPVRYVLETLVKYGAPERILVEGAPHLGTDNLVRLLRNMRQDLRAMGGEIHFGARVDKFHIEDGTIKGVDAICTPSKERSKTKKYGEERKESSTTSQEEEEEEEKTTKTFWGDAVVLATGHSARDVYYELHKSGVELEAKGFAVGFRIEHPQSLINEIQYGKDWGGRVFTRKSSTDTVNKEHFAKNGDSVSHTGTLPVASYRLATNEAWDGTENRGAYSFCQCPGGQIVPSSTEHGELCINGMSFSKRDSIWANSAMVVTVSPDDPILEKYRLTHGTLAGLEFQRDMERKAYDLGGGGMRAPVQRLTDFVNGKVSESESVPSSSYRLGVTSAACHDIYPQPLYNALVHAITHNFDKQMPGFLCDQALLHGVETRTSSPVRVLRDSTTLQASGVDNMFPSGEGAGFAGGIVSAAVDGLLVANAIKTKYVAHDDSPLFNDVDKVSVGFDY